MPLHLLPTLLTAIILIGWSPGPANIYSLSMALRYGRDRALRMWFGLLTGFSVAASAVAVSTHFLGTLLGTYVTWLKYLGAAYLLWLAYQVYRSSGKAEPSGRDCTFVSGMLVQLTNAKMIVFAFTAYSTFVLPYSNRLADLFALAAWLLIAGPIANLGWLLAGVYLRRFFESHRKQVDRIMAIALALCAVLIGCTS